MRRRVSSTYHSESCRKCTALTRAKELSIEVHEWPLPEDTDVVNSILFFLDPPDCVFRWVSTTFEMLIEPLSPSETAQSRQTLYTLDSYEGLRSFNKMSHCRLQPASSAKSVLRSDDRIKTVATIGKADVAVKNGMKYAMFDIDLSRSSHAVLGKCNIEHRCRLSPEKGPYQQLEYAKNGTGHTTNKVIVEQTDCSMSLPLHEYNSFGSLCAGYLLQWLNLARELTGQAMDFNHPQVNLLLIHAIYQAGSRGHGGIYRQ